MAVLLRVFLIGVAHEDLASLRARVAHDPALTIVGQALKADLDEGRVRVPEAADVVLMTRDAATHGIDATTEETSAAEPPHRLIEELTPREHDVLALLADGYGNRAIADRLGISEHTVKFHLTSIFGKLGASTRTEAVRRGLDLGIIDI